MFLRNVSGFIPQYTASHPKSYSHRCENLKPNFFFIFVFKNRGINLDWGKPRKFSFRLVFSGPRFEFKAYPLDHNIVFLSLNELSGNDLPDYTKSNFTTLSVAHIISLQTIGWLTNDEFERIWKETVSYPNFRLQGPRKIREDTSVTIIGTPDEIQTDHP